MEEVKAWKLTDGSIYEDYELASKIQKELDFEDEVITFINNKDESSALSRALKEILIEDREILRGIIKSLD